MATQRSGVTSSLDRQLIQNVMHAVVQVVALKRGLLGNMQSLWTGSGTIIDPGGIILTNCHVANPRALGMPSPQPDLLAIATTQRSDEPPALTYIAEIAAQSPEMDLAVLRITGGLDGKPVRKLELPHIPVGDSDALELGDVLTIFGYPGIGGETVTLTSGMVSGFTGQKGIGDRRAWIKSDATIAGGNSGGTAVNSKGELVAVPTQAAAGTGITPVDARPVVDTNLDGRVDQRDTPMAVGGFINGLRPINLAKPLLTKAGAGKAAARPRQPRSTARPSARPSARPVTPVAPVAPKPKPAAGPQFGNLMFSTQVTSDGRPIAPATVLPSGHKQIFATFDFTGMRNGRLWKQVWAVNDQIVVDEEGKWSEGPSGRKVLQLANPKGLPEGRYHLVLTVSSQVIAEGEVNIGRRVDDTDTEVSGKVVDRRTGRGVAEALVIALKPGVSTDDFVRTQDQKMAYTHARTDRQGRFTFPQQLPKGQAYGLIVVARGYRDMAIESALRISAQAPEHAALSPIPLIPD